MSFNYGRCENPSCKTCYPQDMELPESDPKKWGRWSPSTAQPGLVPTYSLDYKSGWFDGYHAAKNAP